MINFFFLLFYRETRGNSLFKSNFVNNAHLGDIPNRLHMSILSFSSNSSPSFLCFAIRFLLCYVSYIFLHAFLTAANNSAGGSCRYPWGLLLTHRQRSSQAFSMVSSVFQFSSELARVGLAVRSKTSPARRATTSYFKSRPTTALNALTISKTVLPRPEPRFQALTPGLLARR